MPTIQNLKKKLRSIRSTQKLAKAMKTASTVKYSRINTMLSEYSEYENSCEKIYKQHRVEFNEIFKPKRADAPKCLIVMASNKGMCGSFNTDILNFAESEIKGAKQPYYVIICGNQAELFFTERNLRFDKSISFSDVPKYDEALTLLRHIYLILSTGQVSSVNIIYPKYHNMLNQQPEMCDLFDAEGENEKETHSPLFVPDKKTVINATAEKIMASFVFKRIIETALGAQAATLMTMRSAHDTATDYCLALEKEINRKRQSQVTADVLETSAEFSMEGE